MSGDHYPRASELPDDIRGEITFDATVQALEGRPRDLTAPDDCAALINFIAGATKRSQAEVRDYWPHICEQVVAAQSMFGVLPDNEGKPLVQYPPIDD